MSSMMGGENSLGRQWRSQLVLTLGITEEFTLWHLTRSTSPPLETKKQRLSGDNYRENNVVLHLLLICNY